MGLVSTSSRVNRTPSDDQCGITAFEIEVLNDAVDEFGVLPLSCSDTMSIDFSALFSAPEVTDIEVVVTNKQSRHIRSKINRTKCFIDYSRFITLVKNFIQASIDSESL